MDQYRQWSRTRQEGEPYLSVVVPTYNEEWRILPTVGAIASFVCSITTNWELIVADDGSTDETLKLLDELDLVNLKVLKAEANAGKGAAVRRGIEASQGNLILFADADQATPIEQLPNMISAVDSGSDIAIGSRSGDGATVANKSLPRKILSAGLQKIVRAGFRLDFKDTQCGFKLFRRDAAKQIFAVQQINGFSFDLEVLYIACRSGMEVAEIPVEWHDAPGSSVSGGRDSLKFLADMPKILFRDLKGDYEFHGSKDMKTSPQVYEAEIPDRV